MTQATSSFVERLLDGPTYVTGGASFDADGPVSILDDVRRTSELPTMD